MTPRRSLLLLAFLLTVPLSAVTRDNDDSCDIALLPAATLLLPFFEVDVNDPSAANTRITITNVTNADRVAHVTLWTDRGYPVLGFNVKFTGYDLEVIDLFDVINRGVVPSSCTAAPPAEDVRRLRSAFTTGSVAECTGIGGQHANAIGYATIDVVGSCSATSVDEREYWTRDLRYDNVFTGDYENLRGENATGGPLVHIRAVPEGGTPAERRAAPIVFDAGFPRTFYALHQPADAPLLDGRQPLPSRFTSHWIQGGPDLRQTVMKVWREGLVRADAPCSTFAANARAEVVDLVRFDENEYGIAQVPDSRLIVPTNPPVMLPVTSLTSVADASVWPQLTNGATSGWLMVNLAVPQRGAQGSQGWMTATMSALDRFSTEIEATALGNGCSFVEPISNFRTGGGLPIAPSPNVNRSARPGRASTNNDDSCDIGLLPAATLLLPHFRVDTEPTRSVTTLFAITNTGPEERIARVTLWTDLAYPVLTFNVYLTGYDMQSIDLYDVIARGFIAPERGTGTSIPWRGRHSVRNRDISLSGCELLPGALAPQWTERMIRAFTEGSVPECEEVGTVHSLANGYATIDVVRNCATVGPTESSYWTRDVAFDNVLTGDYQIVDHTFAAADGAPLVHIRAVPEGGGPSAFARTFYQRHSNGRDGRQPLPSTFAVPWNSAGGVEAATLFEIWREGPATVARTCDDYARANRSYTDVVIFDDRENPVADRPSPVVGPFPDFTPSLPSTSRTHILDASVYPRAANDATHGWAYFNLGDQAWIVATQLTRGRYSVRRDGVALGNGCSPQTGLSQPAKGTVVIGPAP